MVTPLLSAKLHVPPHRHDLVTRPRLLRRLDGAVMSSCPLVLVSAPPGYGKTTLLSEWAQGPDLAGRCAWLSVDEEDGVPARFFSYLLAAVRAGWNGQGGLPGLLALPEPPPAPAETHWIEPLIAAILNCISAAAQPVVLILDNYHKIAGEAVHAAIQFLLDHRLAALRLVLITRADPPLALARLRAECALTEIRAGDLQFSREEAAEFLVQTMDLDVDAGITEALRARTEGWIAGLQLAAIALRGHADPHAFVRAFGGSHRYVIDYLVEEVLRQQSEGLRDFLARTSVLDRFNAPLCDALTGRTDSQSVLAQLEHANLFVTPLDDTRGWYRYHQLFADSLRMELDEDLRRDLQRRAGRWLAAHGLLIDAVCHALAAGDQELAADFITQAVRQSVAWSAGDIATFLGWLSALPPEVVHARPRLTLYVSRALYIGGQFAAGERMVLAAYAALHALPAAAPERTELLGIAATYRALYETERGDARRALEYVEEARACLPENDAVSRARATHALGLACDCTGNVLEAIHAYRQAAAEYAAPGYAFGAIAAASHMALAQITRGHLRRAVQTAEEAWRMGAPGGRCIPAAGPARIAMGEALRERNDLQRAAQCLTEGLELCKQARIVEALRIGYVSQARLCQALDDGAAALESMRQAEDITQAMGVPRLWTWISAQRVRLALARGEPDLPARWAREYRSTHAAGPDYLREFEDLTLARVLLSPAVKRPGEALALLEAVLSPAEAAWRMGAVIEALALQALAWQVRDEPARALQALRRALELARPEGYARVFLDEGPPMLRLLGAAVERDVVADYAAYLLQTPDGNETAAAAPLAEPLTEQELSVLRLIAAGRSNREIAQALTIALSTVKSHVDHLYGKLGVHSRTQAVRRAREWRLLEP